MNSRFVRLLIKLSVLITFDDNSCNAIIITGTKHGSKDEQHLDFFIYSDNRLQAIPMLDLAARIFSIGRSGFIFLPNLRLE